MIWWVILSLNIVGTHMVSQEPFTTMKKNLHFYIPNKISCNKSKPFTRTKNHLSNHPPKKKIRHKYHMPNYLTHTTPKTYTLKNLSPSPKDSHTPQKTLIHYNNKKLPGTTTKKHSHISINHSHLTQTSNSQLKKNTHSHDTKKNTLMKVLPCTTKKISHGPKTSQACQRTYAHNGKPFALV